MEIKRLNSGQKYQEEISTYSTCWCVVVIAFSGGFISARFSRFSFHLILNPIFPQIPVWPENQSTYMQSVCVFLLDLCVKLT